VHASWRHSPRRSHSAEVGIRTSPRPKYVGAYFWLLLSSRQVWAQPSLRDIPPRWEDWGPLCFLAHQISPCGNFGSEAPKMSLAPLLTVGSTFEAGFVSMRDLWLPPFLRPNMSVGFLILLGSCSRRTAPKTCCWCCLWLHILARLLNLVGPRFANTLRETPKEPHKLLPSRFSPTRPTTTKTQLLFWKRWCLPTWRKTVMVLHLSCDQDKTHLVYSSF